MSYPILYSPTEENFNHNGFGILNDCVSCEVTEEANGIFELSMQYPVDGIHFYDITSRAIIKAKADQFRDPQLFRVYAITKPISGIVSVLAQHISYDLSGIPVKPFMEETAPSALQGRKNNAVIGCPFDFWTDKITTADFRVDVPSSIRACLGGTTGSFLDIYGGEFEFDNYTVKAHDSRGMDRGVSIRYGKNLTDIKQQENCSNVATGVYPYWIGDVSGESVLVELQEKIVPAPGTYNFVKIKVVDFSQHFKVQPTEEELRERTERYIRENKIGVPVVSMTVSFVQLDQTEEYKHLGLLEKVGLFDSLNVEFSELGVSATAKAVKIVYDVILDRVKSVTLGSVQPKISDTIANQQQEIMQMPTKSDLQKAQEAATAWLTNGKGYAYFRKDDLGNIVDILFMDTQDPATAINVMRVGQSGIGFSMSGVDGPYYSAWTIDGNFNANFIRSGKISSQDGTLVIDLSTGSFSVKSENGNKIFTIAKQKDENENEYAVATMFDVDGNVLVNIVEDASRTGGGVEVRNNDGSLSVIMQATNRSAGVRALYNGQTVASLAVDSYGYSAVQAQNIICEQINGNPV